MKWLQTRERQERWYTSYMKPCFLLLYADYGNDSKHSCTSMGCDSDFLRLKFEEIEGQSASTIYLRKRLVKVKYLDDGAQQSSSKFDNLQFCSTF